MMSSKIALAAVLGAALANGPAIVRAQQPPVDRDLEEAKALYREASFAEAIVRLQGAIGRLKLLQNLEARKIQLADAYLHLALSYFALDDRAAAKENLKGMLRLDRERRLDTQIYAPPILDLLEEARQELAQEAPAASPRAAAAPTPPTAAKGKGGSKTLPILLGGGAAAAGVAVAAGGGSSGSGGPTPAPTPTPTPTLPPNSQQDIVVLGSDPPPGSTISVVPPPRVLLTLHFSVVFDQSGTFSIDAGAVLADRITTCTYGSTLDVRLTAGVPQNVAVPTTWVQGPCDARLPVTSTLIGVELHPNVRGRSPSFLAKQLPATYTFVR